MKTSKLLLLGTLLVALCMATPAMAANADGSVTPGSVPNSGTSVLHFTWDIYNWTGTATYHTFAVHNSGSFLPLYIQYSDGAGVDNFPGIVGTLQNIAGSSGVHIQNPEWTDPHDWIVPATLPAGNYWAFANLYIQGQSEATAGAFISFTITQAVPDIDIEKYVSVDGGVTWLDADAAPGPSVVPGADVRFKVEVCNTGDVTLTGIVVTDTDFTFTGVATSLASGACDESDVYVVPGGALAGQQYDNADVVGTPPIGGNVTDEDPAYYYGPSPNIDIEKLVSVDGGVTWLDADAAPGPSAVTGADVRFKVEVCNTGDVTLTGIVVTDTDFTFTGVLTSLASGACDESDVYIVPGGAVLGQQYDNADVVGTPPIGGNVTDEDPANYYAAKPDIDIEKYVSVDGGVTWLDADAAPGPDAVPGADIRFKVEVCNTGDVPLTGIVVTDTDFTFTGVATSLAPGQCDESDVYIVPGGALPGQQSDEACVDGTWVGPDPVGTADDVIENDCDLAYYYGREPGGTFCTFTQGYYGNAGGKKCGGMSTTQIIDAALLGGPVVVGLPGNSITLDSAECIIDLLPAGGTAAVLPAGNFGCPVDGLSPIPGSLLKAFSKKESRFNNVLIGQIVALTLNLRLYEIECTEDIGDLAGWTLPAEFCTLGKDGCPKKHTTPDGFAGMEVGELLAMANAAISGEDVGVSISDINGAVSFINEAFDECAEVVDCGAGVEICGNGCDDDFDGLTDEGCI